MMIEPRGAESPVYPLTNSAVIAPMTESPAATRNPVMMPGVAEGSSSFHQVTKRPAR